MAIAHVRGRPRRRGPAGGARRPPWCGRRHWRRLGGRGRHEPQGAQRPRRGPNGPLPRSPAGSRLGPASRPSLARVDSGARRLRTRLARPGVSPSRSSPTLLRRPGALRARGAHGIAHKSSGRPRRALPPDWCGFRSPAPLDAPLPPGRKETPHGVRRGRTPQGECARDWRDYGKR